MHDRHTHGEERRNATSALHRGSLRTARFCTDESVRMLHSSHGGNCAHQYHAARVCIIHTHRARAYIERCARTAEIRMHADWLCASGTSHAARLDETGVGAGQPTPGALRLQSHTCTGSRIVQPAAHVYAWGRQVRACRALRSDGAALIRHGGARGFQSTWDAIVFS